MWLVDQCSQGHLYSARPQIGGQSFKALILGLPDFDKETGYSIGTPLRVEDLLATSDGPIGQVLGRISQQNYYRVGSLANKEFWSLDKSANNPFHAARKNAFFYILAMCRTNKMPYASRALGNIQNKNPPN